MNLAKKILAAACISAGLFANQNAFSFGKADEDKYKILYIFNCSYLANYQGPILNLSWSSNKNAEKNFEGVYSIRDIKRNGFFELILINDKNYPAKGNPNDYQKFFMKVGMKGIILGCSKQDDFGYLEDLFYYRHVGRTETDGTISKLEAVKEYTNDHLDFNGKEFIRESNDFEDALKISSRFR